MTTLNGSLVSHEMDWRVPTYAQSMLWMQQGEHAAQLAGPLGAFTLDVPGEGREEVRFVWGTADGPPLAIWFRPDTEAPFVVGWQGTVAVGGFIDRLHVLTARGLDIVIAELEGELLPPDYRRLPTLSQMAAAPFSRQDDSDISFPTRDHTYPLIAMADSIQAEYLHHAMVSELAVDCFATLAPQPGRWHEIVGLPLLLDAVSLLAPGLH